jgi:hypothetical protein
LLDRMRVDAVANPPEPSTILGDWYANHLRLGKQQFILCVSEKTLLFDVLKAPGISWSAIDREMNEMSQTAVGRTPNRRVLGILNEFAFAAPYRLVERASLVTVALWLARTPCSPLAMESPDRATSAAFAEALH